jgi:release factor glutamine methyltransferase
VRTPASEGVTWRELAAEAEAVLREAGLPSPEVDARRIVERASGNEGADYHLHLDDRATERGVAFFDRMVPRRAAGEPLQYVVGRWGFRRLDLFVDRRVLIPRPETEVVVEEALAEARRLGATTAVDLGTGSGAIGLSLAVEHVSLQVWVTDASSDALAVASANAAGLGRPGARVRICEGSWFDALPAELRGALDLIVSNPPYVAEDEELPAEVADWEPREALYAGPTGLEAVEVLVAGAPVWLRRPGALVVELAPHQADAALAMAEGADFEADVRPDLTGRLRVLVARLS